MFPTLDKFCIGRVELVRKGFTFGNQYEFRSPWLNLALSRRGFRLAIGSR